MGKFILFCIVTATICVKDIWCRHRSYHDDGKIVGGNSTTIEKHPYQAYLLLYDGRDYYQCGGSIISKRAIVTAAHCLTGIQRIYVRIGSTEASSGGIQYQALTYSTHPRYNSATSDYDAGVVKLARDMDLDGTNARAITMVNTGYDPADGTNMTFTGWGATSEGGATSSTLQVVQAPVVARSRCNQELGGGSTSRMFCAGVPEGGKDTCQGDSGGPAVVSSTGKLAGIVSFGYGCARPNSPGVYTLIGNFEIRTFIRLATTV